MPDSTGEIAAAFQAMMKAKAAQDAKNPQPVSDPRNEGQKPDPQHDGGANCPLSLTGGK